MNGLPNQRAQSTPGRSDPPVKPTSEVAHQPGQLRHDQTVCRYPTLSALCPACARLWASELVDDRLISQGPAEGCSTERSRAPDRQPVAPVEGRAWETPADRTV